MIVSDQTKGETETPKEEKAKGEKAKKEKTKDKKTRNYLEQRN